MRQVRKEVEAHFGDRFAIGSMSMQGVIMEDEDPVKRFLHYVPRLILTGFNKEISRPSEWEEWTGIFLREKGLFVRPVVLFIDEFDGLPPKVVDRLVTLFRDMYLNRDSYLLHGLALIGVRGVLGIESERGSPFNIQRSLHVPNLTEDEVKEMFEQYQEESGQHVDPGVVNRVFESTRGQPGLVSWFGELLTEKYNPGFARAIDSAVWEEVYEAACHTEWNNTILNLVKKARGEYRDHVLQLFTRGDVFFSLDAEWCSYLYLNGIIDGEKSTDASGKRSTVCIFSSPFVQFRIYNALSYDLVGGDYPVLSLDPFDELEDVFEPPQLDLSALLQRYKDYLIRLKAGGCNPWKEQPRRSDLQLREAIGHFHLYAWLQNAVGGQCVISPEFPTGNGRVDLYLKCREKRGIIEVKSFMNAADFKVAKHQAAKYAKQVGLITVTVALFVPMEEEEVLSRLSGKEIIEGVQVAVVAIGWA
jgi:hypothetical protein